MTRPDEIAGDITEEQWGDILARDLTFKEIEAKFGHEVAVYAGIVRDPDAFELDDEWFKSARPAIEVERGWVERWRRTRGKQEKPVKQRVSIRLDADVTEHFRSSGPGWQTRLNDTLRRAVFGP